MQIDGLTRRFAYALVSAVPIDGLNATGIGIVYKGDDRETLSTWCEALPGIGAMTATYEALMQVLQTALEARMRRVTIYTDNAEVVGQLSDDAEVPREVLVPHLQTRGMINQLGRVKLVIATSDRFSARLLAEGAQGQPDETEAEADGGRQLSLLDARL